MKWNKILITVLILFTITAVTAQDVIISDMQKTRNKDIKGNDSSGWKKFGTLIMNISQGALSNWVAGGEKSLLGINGILNYSANYKKGKNAWDNYFDIALGFQNAESYEQFRKIDDRIDITSKYGYRVNHNWYASLLVNFRSQMLPGYDYTTNPASKISNFLTPGNILLSPGLDYKTASRFTCFISPFTLRWVLKSDDDFFNQAHFGVDSAKRVNLETGAFLTAKYTAPFAKWAVYTGRLDLFSNYLRNPQNIDMAMTNLLTLKFNRIFAANISLDFRYDDDVLGRLQMKEILGIGITLNL